MYGAGVARPPARLADVFLEKFCAHPIAFLIHIDVTPQDAKDQPTHSNNSQGSRTLLISRSNFKIHPIN